MIQQSLKEVNEQRDLLNYEYSHMYNVARKGLKHTLRRLTNRTQPRVSSDSAEYGVLVTKEGKRKCWKFDTFERCVTAAQAHDGTVIRLGRNPNFHGSWWDAISLPMSLDDLPLVVVDESGVVEFQDINVEGDHTINGLISAELENLGWPRAIQCDRTPPPAKVLLELHKQHSDIAIEDFAVAVLKHCEVTVGNKNSGRKHLAAFKSDEQKEQWYSSPAGQKWLKEYSIPPIMSHTKKELPAWKNPKQSKS